MGTGVQPGEAAAEQFDIEVAALQVHLVDAGDFQLAPSGRPHLPGDLHHAVVVEVQAGDGELGLGLERLFLDGDRMLLVIELDHTKALRVLHLIAEHGGAFLAPGGLEQHEPEALTVENVVAEHQAHRVGADELFANEEGLRQAVGARLHGIAQIDAERAAIPEQALETRDIVWRADQQDVANSRQHQCRQRVIDHRLVVDRQQLLGNAPGDRVQPGPGTAGQDNAFHHVPVLVRKRRSAQFLG
ncbi:hypothetical protein D3C84_693250 [compost metagenome]